MPKKLHALTALALVSLLTACGKGSSDSASSQGAQLPSPYQMGNIIFDTNLPADQRAQMAAAYQSLDANPMSRADPEMLRLMKIPNASGPVIRKWIEERVQVIVPEDFDEDAQLHDNNFAYDNPYTLPDRSKLQKAETAKTGIVMSNLGVVLYLEGKMEKYLVKVKIAGLGLLAITSPRTGLLQMGSSFNDYNDSGEIVNRSFQIATFVHEARHSDGNGRYVGFLHMKCPSGDYAGRYGCDRASNGPYKIDALVQKAYLNSCARCTAGERSLLSLLYFDVANRPVGTAGEVDDRPEGKR